MTYPRLVEKKSAQEIFLRIEFIITHLDSQYGFIKKLQASPDYQLLKKDWFEDEHTFCNR